MGVGVGLGVRVGIVVGPATVEAVVVEAVGMVDRARRDGRDKARSMACTRGGLWVGWWLAACS